MRPDFNFTGVDLVANRNSLRKLFAFAAGRMRESFRIDLHMVQKTLFLTRRERNLRELIRGRGNSRFGHSFERAFSIPQLGLEKSTGHHRVICYTIGNLNCIIRFEVDACCDKESSLQGSNEEGCDVLSLSGDDISASFAGLSLAEKSVLNQQDQYRRTNVILGGHLVPSSRTAEIKTRSKRLRLEETLPQLWFGRTPHLFFGIHENGTFTRVEAVDAASQFPDWEKRHQVSLCKMVHLITAMREATMGAKDGSCVAVYNHNLKPPQLELRTSLSKKRVLPGNIIEQYWRHEKKPH
jgi:hypothetical protein